MADCAFDVFVAKYRALQDLQWYRQKCLLLNFCASRAVHRLQLGGSIGSFRISGVTNGHVSHWDPEPQDLCQTVAVRSLKPIIGFFQDLWGHRSFSSLVPVPVGLLEDSD